MAAKKTSNLFVLSHRIAPGMIADGKEIAKEATLATDIPVRVGETPDEYGWSDLYVLKAGDVREANAFIAGWFKGRARGY